MGKKPAKRMQLTLPPEYQLAVRKVALRVQKRTSQVIESAIFVAFPQDVADASRELRKEKRK